MRQAYTVIELLVVCAIIAVVAGIIGAAVRVGRQSAQHAACVSNLRSVGQALHLYAGDYDQFIPPYLTKSTGIIGDPVQSIPALPQAWRDCLEVYARSKETFFCPLDRQRSKRSRPGEADTTYTSYETTGAPFDQDRFGPNHTYRINISTPTPMMSQIPYAVDLPMRDMFAAPTQNPYYTFHGKRQNLLYLDGRVKAFQIPDRNPDAP